MTELPPEIRRHYAEAFDEDDRIRGGLNELEFVRTQRILRRHLGAPPLRIADVGGATGVHSEWLLEDGHEVTLIEPVPEQVDRANARLGHHPAFQGIVGNGLALPLDDALCDAVLLMGPLYHLMDRGDRSRVFAEALRVLRPGGLMAGAAISRFASLLDGLQQEYLFEPSFAEVVYDNLETGEHRNPDGRPEWFTTAYFHRPADLVAEARAGGFLDAEVIGVEGPAALFPNLTTRWEEPAGRAAILESAARVESEPELIGASPHLLVIGHAPD